MRLAQLDRAFGYGPKGRGFESSSARVKRKGDAKSISLFFSEATRKIRTRFVSPLRSGRRRAKVHWTLCVLRFAPVGAKPRSTGPCAPSSARFYFESRKPLFIKVSGFFHALRIRLVLWSTVVHLILEFLNCNVQHPVCT